MQIVGYINITIKIHNLQNQTEAHKTHNHIYSDTKWNQKILQNVINERAI